jgi:hypothetical protein
MGHPNWAGCDRTITERLEEELAIDVFEEWL